jgi:3-hydroxyisobutyrate dehydrogenase-like beta-hydroxyacid dehydrogenase
VIIGLIGLGHMGGSMAARYLAAGYTVYGESRDREDARWLTDEGLRWASTPRAVAEAADIIMTSLPDDDVVESVATGSDGIVAGLAAAGGAEAGGAGAGRAGAGRDGRKVWADLSTVSPAASRALATRVNVEGKGAQMLDAPVSGSVPQVKAGSLTIMVGGDAAAFNRVEPVLRVLGTPVHVGAHGHGLVLKLAINISLAVQMLAFSEGLLLADRDGIDPHLAAKVMSESAIGSPMLKARVPLVLDDPDQTWFDVALMHKDIRLALAAAREYQVPLPSAEVADKVLARATDLGYARRDIAAIFEVLGTDGSGPAT